MKRAYTYAKALLELAQDAGKNDQIAAEMEAICKCISENPQYTRLLDAAHIPLLERLEIIDAAFGNVHEYIANMMKLLAENAEAYRFKSIAAEYAAMHDRLRGITGARLILPCEISAAALDELYRRLNKKTGRKMRLDVEIDPALIGGLRLEMEGRIYDNSLRTKMQRITERITGRAAEEQNAD